MVETIAETFARFADDAEYVAWERQEPAFRLVYACRDGSVWKFTPEEWWRFVRSLKEGKPVILPNSHIMARCPNFLFKVGYEEFCSNDKTVRCVNLLGWTSSDWKKELALIAGNG